MAQDLTTLNESARTITGTEQLRVAFAGGNGKIGLLAATGFGFVRMIHDSGGNWSVWDPNGNPVSTGGTTTSGLQEAINFAFNNGYGLYVYAGNEVSGNIWPISCSSGITFPAMSQGCVYMRGVSIELLLGTVVSTDGITFNSMDLSDIDMSGCQIIYTATGAVVRFAPTSANPEGFTGMTSSRIKLPTCVPVVSNVNFAADPTKATGVRFSVGTGSVIVNCVFDIGEINCGATAITVDNPAATTHFYRNEIRSAAIHGQGTNGVQNGTSSAAAGLIQSNRWYLTLAPSTGTAFSSYGQFELMELAIAGGTTGCVLNGNNNIAILGSGFSASYTDNGAGNIVLDSWFGAISTSSKATTTVLTSGTSATYTTPGGCKWLKLRAVGGGGGGCGSGTGATAGGNGTSTSFSGTGITTITCGSGGGGQTSTVGGTGGSAVGGDVNISGGAGSTNQPGTNVGGGAGASSPFGGATGGGSNGTAGFDAATGSGSGAGGAGSGGGTTAAAGGGAGGYAEKTIINPVATYTYTVGAGGSQGGAGSPGNHGGAGGSGIIIIEEHYA